jgi:hypothetical protein
MKMKKIFAYLTVILFLTACNNAEIGIKYKLTAVIDGTSLVSSLVNPYDNTNLFPVGKVETNYNVRTTYLIYDKAGLLVDQESILTESFFDNVTFSKNLEAGNYTVVTIMDIVYNKLDLDWTFSNLSKLETANITMGVKVPSQNGILGFHKELVTITNESKSLSFTPQHLGALYVIHFDNVDYSKIRYVNFRYDLNPDTYQINSNNFAAIGTYYNSQIFDNEGKYTGDYEYEYLLPNTNLALNYTLYDLNNNLFDGLTYTVHMDIIAGQHKLLEMDLTKSTNTTTPLSQVKSSTNILNVSHNKSISIDKIK